MWEGIETIQKSLLYKSAINTKKGSRCVAETCH